MADKNDQQKTDESDLQKVMARHPLYPKFCEWYQNHSDRVVKDITLLSYLSHLEHMRRNYGLDLDKPNLEKVIPALRKKVAAKTLSLRGIVLRKWLTFRDIPLDGLEPLLKTRKGEERRKLRPEDLLTIEEVLDIVSHTQSARLRAFWMVLYDTGCRPNELCQTNTADVQQDQYGYKFTFWETKTKQSKRSVRLLTPQAIQYFEQWWAIHPRRNDPSAPVFLNTMGRRVRAKSFMDLLKKQHQSRLGRTNGEKAPLNLYLFRKSRATQLLKEKQFSEIEIKMRMGHKKHSQMLEQYYAILDSEDQDEAELRVMGAAPKTNEVVQPVTCPSCGALNEADSLRCVRCRLPMSEEKAIQVQKAAVESFQSLLSDPETLKTSFESLLSDPGILKVFASAVAEALVQEREK